MQLTTRLWALFLCLLPAFAGAYEWSPEPQPNTIRMTGGKRIAVVPVKIGTKRAPEHGEIMRALLTDPRSTDAVWRFSSGGKLWVESVTILPTVTVQPYKGCMPPWGSGEPKITPITVPHDLLAVVTVGAGSGCSARGQAVVGGNVSWSSGPASGYLTHEIGHNLGFGHASAVGSEYGDSSDTMGGTTPSPHNAPNRIAAGWMPPGSVIDAPVGLSTHTIQCLDATSNAPQVVRWRTPKQSSGDHVFGDGYGYASLRCAIGLDASLSESFLNAVSVHERAWYAFFTRQPTMRRGQFKAGQEYASKDLNYRVRVLDIAEDGRSARIEVDAGLPGCAAPFPTTKLSGPSEVEQGGVAEIVATFTSNSPDACIAQDFKVVVSGGPAGAPKEFASVVRLRPGESRDVRIIIAIPSSQPLGKSTLSVSAIPGSSGTYPAKHTMTIVPATTPLETEPEPESEPEPTTPLESEPEPTDEPPTTPLEPEPVEPELPDEAPELETGVPGSASIPAAADTYLSTYHPANAFGAKTQLMDSDGRYFPMLRFNVFASQGGPVPDGAEVVRAVVRVYREKHYNSRFGLHRNLGPWSENVTLRTAPDYEPVPDAVADRPFDPGQWYDFELTPGQLLAGAEHGWRLIWQAGNKNIKHFTSREGDPETAPRLEVEWR